MKYNGLSSVEVEKSRLKNGLNILTPPPRESAFKKFLGCFNDPLIKILLLAMVMSVGIAVYEALFMGEGIQPFFEPLGIFIAILLATLIGFVLEQNANKKFEVLNQVNDEDLVTVIRDGEVTQVAKKDIVVGDIVLVKTGDEIPADGNLLDSVSLSVNESTLTGELMCSKSHIPGRITRESTYPSNRLFRGTTVLEGNGTFCVDAVGDATEFGKVYVASQIVTGVKTPLTLQLEKLGKVVSYISYTVGILILIGRMFLYDYNAPFNVLDFVNYTLSSFMLAITLIVVSVPEGLPMSITLSLALSMRRMLKTNNLVRKMHACETMGAVTVICTDKTGTLTQNQMSVYDSLLVAPKGFEEDYDKFVSEAISLNTTAFLDRKGDKREVLGNPTEGALLLWLDDRKQDYVAIRESIKVIEQLPFSTMRKYMATVVSSQVLGKKVLFVKGAPEIVMGKCQPETIGESIRPSLDGYQQKAMRTLAFAYKVVDDRDIVFTEDVVTDNDMVFMGIVAIADPVRAGVSESVGQCLNAGIEVKMVTGDTVGTAKEIGRQVGLWNDDVDNDSNIIVGSDFAALPDDEAAKVAQRIKIMSRARPTDKSRLVELLQKNNHVVAVTGDGTNDAPALNAAHVGLSMGDGTSVAKEASDITILDNSFESISKAVMWGRSLYRNIQRFILFQLTVNLVACIVVLVGAFTGQQSPLTVTQMLWVNLIMDTFAALSLASLPPSSDVMNSKPRKISDFIITKSMRGIIFAVSAAFLFVLVGFMQYMRHTDLPLSDFSVELFFANFFAADTPETVFTQYELTIFFTLFVFLQFWNLFNAKSYKSRFSAFRQMGDSKVFFMTVLAIIIGQVVIVTFGGEMFGVVPLKLEDWLILFFGSSVVMILGEIGHLFYRRRVS